MLTNQMALSLNIHILADYYIFIKLRLRVSDRQGKHNFAQDCLYFQGVFICINERDTSFPDCKHKHMLENGAPPYKFGVVYTVCYI